MTQPWDLLLLLSAPAWPEFETDGLVDCFHRTKLIRGLWPTKKRALPFFPDVTSGEDMILSQLHDTGAHVSQKALESRRLSALLNSHRASPSNQDYICHGRTCSLTRCAQLLSFGEIIVLSRSRQYGIFPIEAKPSSQAKVFYKSAVTSYHDQTSGRS